MPVPKHGGMELDTWHQVSIVGSFVAGTNVLEFDVENAVSPSEHNTMGLQMNLEGSVLRSDQVSEKACDSEK